MTPRKLKDAPRVRALVLLWRASRALSIAAVAFVLAEGALPVSVLIAMGRVTGAIPAVVLHGLGSAPGHHLVGALGVAGGLYALSLMRGPVEDALTAAASARVDVLMQRRLVAAVTSPVGIEPLEDQDVLERLSSARGELLGSQPRALRWRSSPTSAIADRGPRLSGAGAADLIVVLDHGSVLEAGSHDELMAAAGPTQSCSRCKRAHIGDPPRRRWRFERPDTGAA